MNFQSLAKCSTTHAGYNMVCKNCVDKRSWPISIDHVESHPKFKKLKVELRDLKRKNRELEKELGKADSIVAEGCARHMRLTDENKRLRKDNADLEKEIADLTRDVNEVNGMNRSLKFDADNAQAECVRLECENSALLRSNAALKEGNEALKEDYAVLEATLLRPRHGPMGSS